MSTTNADGGGPGATGPAHSLPDLADLLTRLTVMESNMKQREAQFQAAVQDATQREAAAIQREHELRSQVATLSSALNRANTAVWEAQSGAISSTSHTRTSAPVAQPRPPAATSPAVPVFSATPPTPPASPPKPTASAKKASSPKGKSGPRKKKTAAQVHRVLKEELPEDITGFKEAFFLHLRILWGLLAAFAVPTLPSDVVLAFFDQQFGTMSDLTAARTGPNLVAPDLASLAGKARNSAQHGTHGQKAAQVEESALGFMAALLARFGLPSWAPDFRRTPYSLYNAACRIIAITSFQQAILAHAYIHLAPVLKYAQDMSLMIKLYDHFVHHVQHRRWLADSIAPGILALREAMRSVYQRRTRLKARRIKQLRKSGRERYVKLIDDAKAHSDDERDPKTGQYIVHAKPGRSPRVTHLVRFLDAEYELEARSLGRNPGHTRTILDTMPPAQLPALPRNVTLDWFDVNFYNSLSIHVRKKVARYHSVVLHEEDKYIMTSPPHKYELMPMEQFMHRFGDIIVSQYDVPSRNAASSWTEEDEYWLKGGGNSDDEEDEEDAMEEDDEAMAEAIDTALNEEQIGFRDIMQT